MQSCLGGKGFGEGCDPGGSSNAPQPDRACRAARHKCQTKGRVGELCLCLRAVLAVGAPTTTCCSQWKEGVAKALTDAGQQLLLRYIALCLVLGLLSLALLPELRQSKEVL